MDQIALDIVRSYIMGHLDKSETVPPFDVFAVWKAKILQNWKYLISSTLPDGMYYELTYNGDKMDWKNDFMPGRCPFDGKASANIDLAK